MKDEIVYHDNQSVTMLLSGRMLSKVASIEGVE